MPHASRRYASVRRNSTRASAGMWVFDGLSGTQSGQAPGRESQYRTPDPVLPPYGDSGFKKDFQDGGNQVRHFVGGLWAGYLFGPGVAQLGMNSNEDNTIIDGRGITRSVAGILPTLFPSKDSKPDIALNAISIALGTQLVPRAEERKDVGDRSWRKIPANAGFRGLASQIRGQVCD